ncbi:NnrU family protein [Pannonibacter tanglangensis]|uniref:NnrU family protein n=1 Tax=Pannonibacter tanglangensis TaxID=2750084 RepID=A0ABW9ZGU8_9HYPH|nr:NnrU family protein [Pannonibacter sp. XCT-34]NBN64069.1 NnrU family protein [Pannonibacter sp. XCT-34]
MLYLILGIALFFGAHTLTMLRELRAGLQERLGSGGYKGLYSLVSALGLGLMIYGYGLARFEGAPQIYEPPVALKHVAFLLLLPVFVFLIAAYVPGRIKRALKHPMLVAVKLWALAHLLANGDLASVLLFGSFLVWAVVDRISIKRRVPVAAGGPPQIDVGPAGDVVALVGGLALYGLFVWKLHEWLVGVAPM